jgi:hypothetical protein
MKHILNNLTEQEKNAIREQHTGGMKVMTENFSKLLNSKLGDVKPINEQYAGDRFKDSTRVMGDKGDWFGNIGKQAYKPNGREFLLSYSCGDSDLPQGNAQVARSIAQSFVNAIKGIDISGKGQDIILKNLQSMEKLSLLDWNQVLVEYCKLPKDWDSKNLYEDLSDEVGWSWSKGNTNEYEGMLPNQASTKIESYCKNYASDKTYTDKFNSSEKGFKKPSDLENKFCQKYYEYR